MKIRSLKKLYVLACLLLLQGSAAFGQWIIGIDLLYEPGNYVKLSVVTMYPNGDGQVHYRKMHSHSIVQQNDSLQMGIYYEVSPGPNQFTSYVDTIDLGIIVPSSVNVLTVYPFNVYHLDTNLWDTTAFQDPDTTLLFNWANPVAGISQGDPPLNIYPNPAADQVWLVSAGKEFTGEVIISDVTGAVVLQYRQLSLGAAPVQLDLSRLAPGCYFVRIRDERKRHYQCRLLKN